MTEIYSLTEFGQRTMEAKANVREQLDFCMRSGIYSEGIMHELACH